MNLLKLLLRKIRTRKYFVSYAYGHTAKGNVRNFGFGYCTFDAIGSIHKEDNENGLKNHLLNDLVDKVKDPADLVFLNIQRLYWWSW